MPICGTSAVLQETDTGRVESCGTCGIIVDVRSRFKVGRTVLGSMRGIVATRSESIRDGREC